MICGIGLSMVARLISGRLIGIEMLDNERLIVPYLPKLCEAI